MGGNSSRFLTAPIPRCLMVYACLLAFTSTFYMAGSQGSFFSFSSPVPNFKLIPLDGRQSTWATFKPEEDKLEPLKLKEYVHENDWDPPLGSSVDI